MMRNHCILDTATIYDALSALERLSKTAQVLYVLNKDNMVEGTLTDGDIRRGLIEHHNLSDSVRKIMHSDFQYLEEGHFDVLDIKRLRTNGYYHIPIVDSDKHFKGELDLTQINSVLPIDAVIMAGGKGERLRPLTQSQPKPLLLVGDKAIIDHNVDRLIQFGVDHISVTTNYLAEQLESHYAQPHNEVQIQCVREPKFLGTMGSVRLVKEFHNDVVLVMNSDLFTDIDFEDMYLHFMENNADMSIAAVPYTVSIPFGICDLDGRNVKGIVEKPTYNYYANAGIYLIKREVLDFIPEKDFYNATDLIEDLVKAGKQVIRYPLNGTWIDIGNKEDYQKAQDLARHRS